MGNVLDASASCHAGVREWDRRIKVRERERDQRYRERMIQRERHTVCLGSLGGSWGRLGPFSRGLEGKLAFICNPNEQCARLSCGVMDLLRLVKEQETRGEECPQT